MMQVVDRRAQELDALVDLVLRQENAGLVHQAGTGTSPGVAANLQVIQLLRRAACAGPSSEAKARARARLQAEGQPARTPWWAVWKGLAPGRAIAVAMVAFIVAIAFQQAQSPRQSDITIMAQAPYGTAAFEFAVADEGVDRASKMLLRGEYEEALEATTILARSIARAEASIAEAVTGTDRAKGFDQLVESATRTLARIETTAAALPPDSDSAGTSIASRVSVAYAKSIEALALASLSSGSGLGQLEIDLGVRMEHYLHDDGRIYAYQVDGSGGGWVMVPVESLSTIPSTGNASATTEIAAGVYTRFRIELMAASGERVYSEFTRPLEVHPSATASMAPPPLTWRLHGTGEPAESFESSALHELEPREVVGRRSGSSRGRTKNDESSSIVASSEQGRSLDDGKGSGRSNGAGNDYAMDENSMGSPAITASAADHASPDSIDGPGGDNNDGHGDKPGDGAGVTVGDSANYDSKGDAIRKFGDKGKRKDDGRAISPALAGGDLPTGGPPSDGIAKGGGSDKGSRGRAHGEDRPRRNGQPRNQPSDFNSVDKGNEPAAAISIVAKEPKPERSAGRGKSERHHENKPKDDNSRRGSASPSSDPSEGETPNNRRAKGKGR